MAFQTATASAINRSRCSIGDDRREHRRGAPILGRSGLPFGAKADDAGLDVKLDFLDQQRLAVEQRDGEFPPVDEFLHEHRRLVLIQKLLQALQERGVVAGDVVGSDSQRRIFTRELEHQREPKRRRAGWQISIHDEWRRRDLVGDEERFRQRLVQREAKRHGARTRVRDAEQVQQAGDAGLPAAPFSIPFAQVEDDIGLKRFERFDEWTNALVDSNQADTMAERRQRVTDLRRAVDHSTDDRVSSKLHGVVDDRDRA